MAPEHRRQLLLAVLAIILAVVVYRAWPRPTAATAPSTSNLSGSARTAGRQGMSAPDVNLEALQTERVKPQEAERDLFRFQAKAAPPAPSSAAPKPESAPMPSGPPPAPAAPPIALKFIGVWEMPEQNKRIAILSDGKGGVPIYGSEGETVEGRYRIVKIGTEAIELAHLDGRGRQTIRLTGQ
jgi:hypothetical protein